MQTADIRMAELNKKTNMRIHKALTFVKMLLVCIKLRETGTCSLLTQYTGEKCKRSSKKAAAENFSFAAATLVSSRWTTHLTLFGLQTQSNFALEYLKTYLFVVLTNLTNKIMHSTKIQTRLKM